MRAARNPSKSVVWAKVEEWSKVYIIEGGETIVYQPGLKVPSWATLSLDCTVNAGLMSVDHIPPFIFTLYSRPEAPPLVKLLPPGGPSFEPFLL